MTELLTPKQTLENLDDLEQHHGFHDLHFREIHHWKPHESLESHRKYLKKIRSYQSEISNNYTVAQRIAYILKEAHKGSGHLWVLVIEAKKAHKFEVKTARRGEP